MASTVSAHSYIFIFSTQYWSTSLNFHYERFKMKTTPKFQATYFCNPTPVLPERHLHVWNATPDSLNLWAFDFLFLPFCDLTTSTHRTILDWKYWPPTPKPAVAGKKNTDVSSNSKSNIDKLWEKSTQINKMNQRNRCGIPNITRRSCILWVLMNVHFRQTTAWYILGLKSKFNDTNEYVVKQYLFKNVSAA